MTGSCIGGRAKVPDGGSYGSVTPPILLCGPPRYDKIPDGHLHRLAVLILRRRPHLDQSLLRAGLRRPHFEYFALDVELVSRPHRPPPAGFVEAPAHDS